MSRRLPHKESGAGGPGFSLLETLLVVAILAVLSLGAFAFYRGYVKNIELESVSSSIVSDLKLARSRAASGEGNLKWGIRFSNSAQDTYQVFSTPTNFADASTTIDSTVYLPDLVAFSDPADSLVKDIIFSKISATTTATSVSVTAEGNAKTVSVTAEGNVY